MAEPLNESEWSRFWSLLSQPARSPDEHNELADLHAKAQAHIDDWRPDTNLTTAHLIAHAQGVVNLIEQLAQILPAAGGLAGRVAALKTQVEHFTQALKGPAEIPPMPDAPEPAHSADEQLPDPPPIEDESPASQPQADAAPSKKKK